MFHAPMVRFQLELIYYFTYFSPSSHPTVVCFFPVGLLSLIHFQRVLSVMKFLLSPGLGSRQFSLDTLFHDLNQFVLYLFYEKIILLAGDSLSQYPMKFSFMQTIVTMAKMGSRYRASWKELSRFVQFS